MLGKVVVDGDDCTKVDFLDPNHQNMVAEISIKVKQISMPYIVNKWMCVLYVV